MNFINTIHGKFGNAIVYTDLIETSACEQIKLLCDQPFVEGCKICIMPDVHAGAGCVIGFTADLGELVIPNIVGVDIGCGMLTVELGKRQIDYAALDQIIRMYIPSGMNANSVSVAHFDKLKQLYCYDQLKDVSWIECSIGTLGGGNHFIEVDVDDAGNYYLVIHTGSRNLGKQVADIYQQLAYDLQAGKAYKNQKRNELIKELKAAGRANEIQAELKKLKDREEQASTPPKDLCYLTGEYRDFYLHDMKICQEFASLNRQLIAERILYNMFGCYLSDYPHFETIHNYIDHSNNIIRKGAVSAQKGERLIIPINMRDGSLICIGRGNPEWNYSAPHGAGRLFSRSAARKEFTVDAFAEEMTGIYTTSVGTDTLDECPMAYKPMNSIVDNISPTVEIVNIIKPVYNFKAGE